MTGPNYVDHVVVEFPDKVIEMSVHKDETGTCSPVACIIVSFDFSCIS